MVENGGLEVLPNIKEMFWSSSSDPASADLAYIFSGSGGSAYLDRRYCTLSVRCVGH